MAGLPEPRHPPGSKRRDLLLFGGIPVLIILFLGLTALDQEEIARNRQIAEQARFRLSHLLQSIDPHLFIAKRLRLFWKTLERHPVTPRRLQRLTRLAQKRFGFEFIPSYFDASGTLVLPAGASPRQYQTLQEIWDIYRLTPNWTPGQYQNCKVNIRSLVGMEFSFESLKARDGQVVPIVGAEGEAMLFPITSGRFGGMLVVIRNIPPPQKFLTSAQGNQGRPFSLLLRQDDEPWTFSTGRPAPFGKEIQHELNNRSEGWVIASGTLWIEGRAGKLNLLAGQPGLTKAFQAGRIFLLAGSLGAFLLFWRMGSAGSAQVFGNLSLRPRLLLLFLYAVAVPLVGLAFLGFRTITDSREAMVTGVHRKAGELLATIDREFVTERLRSLKLFREVRDHPLARTHPQELRRHCNNLENQSKVNWIEGRDIQSRIVFTTESEAITKRIGQVAEVLSRMYIEDNLAARLPLEGRRMPTQVELFVRSAVENPMLGFSGIVERPDHLHTIKFGDYDLFWYWDVYHNPSHPLALIQGDLKISDVIRAYLRRRLVERHGFEHGAFFVLCQEGVDGRWFPEGTNIVSGSPLDSFAGRVRLSNRPETELVSWRGRSWMALGIPGGNLHGFTLIALYPTGEIDRIVTSRTQLIGFGMVGALLIALIIGMIFTDAFLAPIGVLGSGVLALQRRQRGVRVALDRHDELGDLGMMFNAMMIEIEELLLAKDIQEALIPRSAPSIPGYDLSMINLTASDLGGDYLDILLRADGKLLLVVGDVTGHGVSSSLLTAMAKAVVLQAARRNTPLPLLFERLNRLISRQLRRKKMMTCIAGLLDPEQGTIGFCNGGHLLPIIVRPGKPLEKVEIIHFPLGFSEDCAPFDEVGIRLDCGDAVCLYSDGLVEEMNANQESFGEERLEEHLMTQVSRPTQEILDGIMQRFRAHLSGPDPADDVTMIILKRLLT